MAHLIASGLLIDGHEDSDGHILKRRGHQWGLATSRKAALAAWRRAPARTRQSTTDAMPTNPVTAAHPPSPAARRNTATTSAKAPIASAITTALDGICSQVVSAGTVPLPARRRCRPTRTRSSTVPTNPAVEAECISSKATRTIKPPTTTSANCTGKGKGALVRLSPPMPGDSTEEDQDRVAEVGGSVASRAEPINYGYGTT